MIKKILVPVDGSSHSIKAAEWACDVASKFDAELILLHVLLRGHMPEGLQRVLDVEGGATGRDRPDNLVNMPQEIMARVQDRTTTQLSIDDLDMVGKYVLSNVSHICAEKGVKKVTKKVEEGYAAEVILNMAQSVGADMIVLGSRGLGGLKGLLMGSVSLKVTQAATCTCVTVK